MIAVEVVVVEQTNMRVYLNLLQGYEAEFSKITGKLPNHMGLFDLDTELVDNVFGLLCYLEGKPIGFAAIKQVASKQFEVCEFYIVPSLREQGLGSRFASWIWQHYGGAWQIKQIAGASKATQFWRNAITSFNANYSETKINDEYWGEVTQQSFNTEAQNSQVNSL